MNLLLYVYNAVIVIDALLKLSPDLVHGSGVFTGNWCSFMDVSQISGRDQDRRWD